MCLARRFSRRALLAATLSLTAAVAVAQPVSSSVDDQRFEQFLRRLGLTELQALHLEQSLEKQTDAASKQALAQRLAELYASQLLAHSEEQEKFDAVRQKIEQLMSAVPTAKTAAMEIMLLQAEYHRAETLVNQWLEDRERAPARDAARQILQRIAPELNRQRTQLQEQHDKLVEDSDSASDDQAARRQDDLAALAVNIGRASYFGAWANYYLGLTTGDRAAYQQAREGFRRILGIGDEYAEIEVEYLGLESIWRARSLIGLALAETALGADEDSRKCFALLKNPLAPPEIRDQAAYWELQALLNVERYRDAETLARQTISDFDDHTTQGKVSFCASLVRAGFNSDPPSSDRQMLGRFGLEGLVKIGQWQTAKQLIDKYDIKLGAEAGFYLLWLQGQQQFDEAERSQRAEDYQLAARTLSLALDSAAARQDLGSSGQCRGHLAWCLYRLGDYQAAGREFQLAAERLQAAKDKRAVEAAWMSFVAFQAASKNEPRLKESAIDMLDLIKREFPRHEYAQRAEYYIGKLRRAESPTQVLSNLERVTADSPDYLSARYEVCLLLHQQWSKASADERPELARQVQAAVKKFLDASRDDADKARAAKAGLLAVDVALGSSPPDLELASAYLDRAAALTRSLDRDEPVLADYHYRALQLAQHRDDDADERVHADWLVQHAVGSAFELPALIVMARDVDQAAQSNGTQEQRRQAHALYSRLVALLGDSEAALQSNKNAQVANSRLAHYASELGQHKEAAERLETLLAADSGPPNRSYLRRAGLARFQAGDDEAAIEHWRTLLRGVEKDSEDWFEAKYYQLACLFRIDPNQARVAFDQFRLLYPDLGPPGWRDKFAALPK